MASLDTTVHVHTGEGTVVYGPGQTVAPEHVKFITSEDVWADQPETVVVQEPPRGGPGSGEGAWRSYAESLGITVPEDAKKGDILALVDAHKADQ